MKIKSEMCEITNRQDLQESTLKPKPKAPDAGLTGSELLVCVLDQHRWQGYEQEPQILIEPVWLWPSQSKRFSALSRMADWHKQIFIRLDIVWAVGRGMGSLNTSHTNTRHSQETPQRGLWLQAFVSEPQKCCRSTRINFRIVKSVLI